MTETLNQPKRKLYSAYTSSMSECFVSSHLQVSFNFTERFFATMIEDPSPDWLCKRRSSIQPKFHRALSGTDAFLLIGFSQSGTWPFQIRFLDSVISSDKLSSQDGKINCAIQGARVIPAPKRSCDRSLGFGARGLQARWLCDLRHQDMPMVRGEA